MQKVPFRKVKRAAPEEKLSPGESLHLVKPSGKEFILTRVEAKQQSLSQAIQEVAREIPNPSKRKTDVVAWCEEDDL